MSKINFCAPITSELQNQINALKATHNLKSNTAILEYLLALTNPANPANPQQTLIKTSPRQHVENYIKQALQSNEKINQYGAQKYITGVTGKKANPTSVNTILNAYADAISAHNQKHGHNEK